MWLFNLVKTQGCFVLNILEMKTRERTSIIFKSVRRIVHQMLIGNIVDINQKLSEQKRG